MKYLVASLIASALLGIVIGAYVALRDRSPEVPVPHDERIQAYRDEIRTLGAEPAYTRTVAESAGSSQSAQHLTGHLFGAALYEELGRAGFSACGMDWNGGCLHEVVGRAIAEDGLAVVQSLSKDCVDRFGLVRATACQHGIGHGIIAYLGYEAADLDEALTLCASLTQANPTRACYGGAFMEFNQRSMADNLQRTFDASAPFALCDTLADAYKSACYFWTPTWLMESLFDTARTVKEYAAAGTYCASAPAPYDADCFAGLGYFAPPSTGFSREKTRALCNAASSKPASRDACWKVAAEAVGAPPPAE